MKLSAIDVKKQEFKKSFKGYDVGEVEAYLDTIANQLEMLNRENEELKERITVLEHEKNELNSEIQAIVKSQDMSEEVLENAKKRAELIIKEAEILSSKTKVTSQEEFMNLRQELEDLRNKNEAIIDDIKNYLIEKLNSIEEYSRNRKIFRMDTNISEVNRVNPEKEENRQEDRDENRTHNFGMDYNSENPNN